MSIFTPEWTVSAMRGILEEGGVVDAQMILGMPEGETMHGFLRRFARTGTGQVQEDALAALTVLKQRDRHRLTPRMAPYGATTRRSTSA